MTNTDAEGRLVLADALTDADAENPDLLIDVATLTGAQIVALGNRTSGVMGDEAVREKVSEQAKIAGEDIWPMPIPEEMLAGFDSTATDLKNSGPRPGGMLAAAAFLREFVGDDTAWAHIDIAGPSFNTGSAFGYTPGRGHRCRSAHSCGSPAAPTDQGLPHPVAPGVMLPTCGGTDSVCFRA